MIWASSWGALGTGRWCALHLDQHARVTDPKLGAVRFRLKVVAKFANSLALPRSRATDGCRARS
jgi:hypothetical protein